MAANASFPLISFSLFINLFHLHDSALLFLVNQKCRIITRDAYFFNHISELLFNYMYET